MKYDGTNLQAVLDDHKWWLNSKNQMKRYGSCADFSDAKLYRANLTWLDLSHANFHNANLREAFIGVSDLYMADLSGADLTGANLFNTRLSFANVDGADFKYACWKDAIVEYVNFPKAKNVEIPMACPDSGSFVGWKKCRAANLQEDPVLITHVIVKLLIPESARRSSSTGRKCRSDRAIVMEIQNLKTGEPISGLTAWSFHDPVFKYIPGETVVPYEPFEEDRFIECASGIHFFITREEAVEYSY